MIKSYLPVVLAINAKIADAVYHKTECDLTNLSHKSL